MGNYFWFALAMVLLIAETLGAAGLLVALSSAAVVTGIITIAFTLSWELQLIAFSLLSLVSAGVWLVVWRNRAATLKPTYINEPLQSMVGRTTNLVQAIENGRGKIRIHDAFWSVTGPELPINSKVKIIRVGDDNILHVELVE